MKRLKVGFLMSERAKFDPNGDTSFSIMTECFRRNHTLYWFEAPDLLLEGPRLTASASKIHVEAANVRLGARMPLDLESLDVLVIRKEPPFDAEYLGCTYLLDFLKRKVFMMNSPEGIRNVNEKMAVFRFPRFAPRSAAGWDPRRLADFLKRAGLKRAVLKRTDEKGGEGVIDVPAGDPLFDEKARILTGPGRLPAVAQEFIPHEKTGDKRVLLLDGRPIGAFKRVPGTSDFRANMSRGGRAARTDVTAKDRAMARALAPFLRTHGLTFVGIDVLDGRLTEINVTSPAGIPEINGFDGTGLERDVVDFMERRASRRRAGRSRS